MSDIVVNVTNAGAANVSVSSPATVNTTVGNGGAVNVSLGTVSPGDATVVSGTVQLGTVTTLAPGSAVTVQNSGTAFSAVFDFGIPGTTTDASLLSTGIVPDARLASNIPRMVNNLVQSVNLPSYVDDVVDVGGTLPETGETGKIYVVSTGTNVNKIYRWSGSTFIEISPSPGSTDAVPEGANLYFTTKRAADAAPVQSVAGRAGAITLTSADVGLGNVENTSDANKPVSTAQAAADAAVQAFAVQRANHTGTQTASTISDFATEAAKYGPVVSVAGRTGAVTLTASDVGLGNVTNVDATKRANHTGTQAISTVDGLQAALDGKQVAGSYAAATHSHAIADVTGLQASLDARLTSAVTSLNSLSGAVTLEQGDGVSISASGSKLTISATGGGGGGNYTLPTASASVLGGIRIGSGLTIDSNGVVTASGGGGGGSASIVSSATVSGFPSTGSASNLYVATDARKIFGWDATNSVYVELGPVGGGSQSLQVTIPASDPFFSNVLLLLHGDGNLTDSSGYGRTVTANGNAAATAPGKFGSASFAFDGTGDYLSLTSNDFAFGTGDFTIECWVWLTATGATGLGVFSTSHSTSADGGGICLSVSSTGKPTMLFFPSGNYLEAASAIPTGQWVHLAMVRSGATATLYVNGVSAGTLAGTDNLTAPQFVVGRFYTNIDNYYWNGRVDELRVTKGIARAATVPTAAYPDLTPQVIPCLPAT